MSTLPNHFRRQAEFVEEMAQQISLLEHRRALLAQAQTLHRRADELDARCAADDLGSMSSPPPLDTQTS